MSKKEMHGILAGPREVRFAGSQEASPHLKGEYMHTVLDVAAFKALSLHLLIRAIRASKTDERTENLDSAPNM